MRLLLPIWPPWIEVTEGGAVRLVLADPPAAVSIGLGPLLPLPADPGTWVTEVVCKDLTTDTRPQLLSDEQTATDLGWPLRLVQAQLPTADGTPPALRICAFYQFLYRVAAVTADLTVGEPTRTAEVRALLKMGRPDFTGSEIVAVAELFE